MYKRIVSFGCSFTAGDGISDLWDSKKQEKIEGCSKHAWPAQIAKKSNLLISNYAISGSSNKEILWKILNTDIFKTDLVLIHWTFFERDVIISDHTDSSNYGLSVHYRDKISKFWQKNFTNDNNLKFNSYISYLLANFYLNSKDIKNYNLFVENYTMHYNEFNNQIPLLLTINSKNQGCDGKHPSIKEYTIFANRVHNWLLINDNVYKQLI
jgi:hypothetical protein